MLTHTSVEVNLKAHEEKRLLANLDTLQKKYSEEVARYKKAVQSYSDSASGKAKKQKIADYSDEDERDQQAY